MCIFINTYVLVRADCLSNGRSSTLKTGDVIMENEANSALFINAKDLKAKVQIGKPVEDVEGCIYGTGFCHVDSTAPVVLIEKIENDGMWYGWWYIETEDKKAYYVIEQ